MQLNCRGSDNASLYRHTRPMLDPLESTLALAPSHVHRESREGGVSILRSAHSLGDWPRHLSERLRYWAERTPEHTFLLERASNGTTRGVSWGEARRTVDSLAQALLDRGLGPTRPLMILSENSIAHGLLMLAGMQIGAPVSATSTAYSLMSADFAKLRAIHALLTPGAVFAEDTNRYARAYSTRSTCPRNDGSTRSRSRSSRPPPHRDDSERAYTSLADTAVGKILFTSGSTAEPKGVMTTQRMMCSNQRAIEVVWPFLRERPPVVLDWLPWSHTFGANHNFNMVLFHGGTLLHRRWARTTPDGMTRTACNIRELPPSIYFNVPRGYEMLVPLLEQDDTLARAFFQNLDVIFYAAASLPHPIWERLENASVKARGTLVRMLSAWGAHGNVAACDHGALPDPARRRDRRPSPRYGDQARPVGGKARDPRARAQRDARLLEAGRSPHPRGVRRTTASCAPAMPFDGPTRPIRREDWCSTAGSPRTSSSRQGRGCTLARCALRSCPPPRRSCKTR